MIKTDTFYKAKNIVEGNNAPGGYFYVVESAGNEVTFAVTAQPKKELLTGSTFTLNADEFLKIAGDEATK